MEHIDLMLSKLIYDVKILQYQVNSNVKLCQQTVNKNTYYVFQITALARISKRKRKQLVPEIDENTQVVVKRQRF